MNRTFAGFAAAVFVIILLIWFGFIQTKGNHLAPTGWISSVRTQQLSPELSMMIIDFGVLNDSDQQMVVGAIDPWITTQGGNKIHGSLYAAADMKKTFAFYPKLGPQLNDTMVVRSTIDGHKTVNRMVAVEFDVPLSVITGRRSVTLRLEDITGPEVEMEGP